MDVYYLVILNKNLTDVHPCSGNLSQPQIWNKGIALKTKGLCTWGPEAGQSLASPDVLKLFITQQRQPWGCEPQNPGKQKKWNFLKRKLIPQDRQFTEGLFLPKPLNYIDRFLGTQVSDWKHTLVHLKPHNRWHSCCSLNLMFPGQKNLGQTCFPSRSQGPLRLVLDSGPKV